MSDAIQTVIFTKDQLVIEASIQIYKENLYGQFSIVEAWSENGKDKVPEHVFDVENKQDPLFMKIDEIVTKRLKDDAIYYKEEFKKLGINLNDSIADPMTYSSGKIV
jgi:hypothetical protein